MGWVYSSFSTTAGNVIADLMQAVLASTDWDHLQLSTGTQATTLTSTAAAGATSISTTASIPSGSYIVLWRAGTANGADTPEVRLTTGVSGAGPYTVTFANALTAPQGTYQVSDVVGVGTYLKAVTTRGAQMVVDFLDAALTTRQVTLGVYQAHDGTTAGDKITRYLMHKPSVAGATTDIVRCMVSAGKEGLLLTAEGPRAGETNPDGTSGLGGSPRTCFYLGDINPYFPDTDTTPAVVCAGPRASLTLTSAASQGVVVSRDLGDTTSWVEAALATLAIPTFHATTYPASPVSWQSNTLNSPTQEKYYAPYVVIEKTGGIRGRIGNAFFGGWSIGTATDNDSPGTPYETVEYPANSGEYYISIPVVRGSGSGFAAYTSFGLASNSSVNVGQALTPLVLVPYNAA